jgi:hypothetical protein
MNGFQVCDFVVPLDCEKGKAHIYLLWPCSALELRRFLMGKFSVDPGERDSWEGKCVTNDKVDEKSGYPTAVIALRKWEGNADTIAVLAHECFHAAEWILQRSGCSPPKALPGEPWEAWEDMAYLLQRIMRRALEKLPKAQVD